MKLYPFELPADVHPMAWTLLGFGLEAPTLNRLAKHLFDDLGCRLTVPDDPVVQSFNWAVDWPYDRPESVSATVGEQVDIDLCAGGVPTAATITAGALPPGVRLDKANSRLVGTFTKTGLYSVTVTLFPRVKYDPMGGNGSPNSAGKWIPIDTPRIEVPMPDVPSNLNDLTPLELEHLIADAQRAQRQKLAQEADAEGGVANGD